MGSTVENNFDTELFISPVAMASLQTQFVVGNRQQFGFLYGEILVSNDTFRCDGYSRSNTFYISSVKPVFDANRFQSDILKSNDKTISDTFRKYLVKNGKMEPILGWYFEGNPNLLLKGKDYSLHTKLISQILLFNKREAIVLHEFIAYHAFLAAVVSYSKNRFSRDFSVGFQAFDEKKQLRMCDVKVNIVDHYFRPRIETDMCLINHSQIIEYIRKKMDSENTGNVFNYLQENAFTGPEPDCYYVHGEFIDRCFDLFINVLKCHCSRASESRNIEQESELFDYKTYDVDTKGYQVAMTIIDKTERNLNLLEIMGLLKRFDKHSGTFSRVNLDPSTQEVTQPQIMGYVSKPINWSLGEALEFEVDKSAAEIKSRRTKESLIVSSSSGKRDENWKENAKNSVKDFPLSHVSDNSKEISHEKYEAVPKYKRNSTEKLDTQPKGSAAAFTTLHSSTSDDDCSSKEPNTNISRCKKRRERKKKNWKSRTSKGAENVTQNWTSASENAVVQTSPESQNLRNESAETKMSSFSNIPEDQLLMYNIISPNKSNEMKPSELCLMPVHESMSHAKMDSHKPKSTSTRSNKNEDGEINTDSKGTEMKVEIVKRNTSARVNIPYSSSLNENQYPVESRKIYGKNKSACVEIDFQNQLNNSGVKRLETSKEKNSMDALSPCISNSEYQHNQSTSPSKINEVEQNLVSVSREEVEHATEKYKRKVKDESSESVAFVFGSTDTNRNLKSPVSYKEANSAKLECASNIIVETDQSKSRKAASETLGKYKALHPNNGMVKQLFRISEKPPDVNVESAVDTKIAVSHTPTPIVPCNKAAVSRLETCAVVDSHSAVSSQEPNSSTSQVSTCESSSLPWPRSKNTCIIVPKMKNVTYVNKVLTTSELWKYALLHIPKNLLTSLKSLRCWRSEVETVEQTWSCSDSQSSTSSSPASTNDPPLPHFHHTFGNLLNDEYREYPQSSRKMPVSPIFQTDADFSSQHSHNLPLTSQSKKSNRSERFLSSSEKLLLLRKSYFLSAMPRSPLPTMPNRRRFIPVEYEYTAPNELKFDIDGGVVPLCLLGDKFTITAVSVEEKYANLSTINTSDSSLKANTNTHSSEES